PHWTKPALVAQLKFGEWTDDGILRQPVYLGMRDDVLPMSVKREPEPTLHGKSLRGAAARIPKGREQRVVGKQPTPRDSAQPPSLELRRPAEAPSTKAGGQRAERKKESDLIDELNAIEQGPGSGVLHLPDGLTLDV